MNQLHKLRGTIIFLSFCSLYLIIVLHVYNIQIRNRDFYQHLGQQQYNVTVKVNPPRALIFDRHGAHLALNKDIFSAFVLPNDLKDRDQLVHFLRAEFPESVERLNAHPGARFMFIKRNIRTELMERIIAHGVSDIKFLKEPNRYYPLRCAGTVIGITDIDNTGLCGVELWYNTQLAGQPTTHTLEKDARSGNFYFTKETKVAGHDGTPLTLTIDSDIQFMAYDALKHCIEKYRAKEGAVLIMNPENGDIIAMANYPDFDPHTERNTLDIACTKNRIVTDENELGSVMKVLVALAALEEGVVTPEEIIDCENEKSTFVNGLRINTWQAHGQIPFTKVVEKSNNIGMVKVAHRLGTHLYEHYRRCGFGKKTGIQFPGEVSGFITPPQQWSNRSSVSLSFGYEIAASLLQLGRFFCMLANGGQLITPRLVATPLPPLSLPLYSSNTLHTIRTILENTVMEGTAKRARLDGYKVMGKTGTANMLIHGQYDNNRNLFTFAGIVEKGPYKRVIVTFIKDSAFTDLYASQVAAPLFEHVAHQMVLHDNVM